jgi:hypothetical protein
MMKSKLKEQILLEVRMINKRFFILFLAFIFMISSVYALGVTPARTTIDFSPNLQQQIDYDVINSVGQDMDLVISIQGELSKYISVPSMSSSMSPSESMKSLSYNVNLPETMEPGLHTADVFILQVPKGGSESGANVLATLAVVTQLHVYVPYPGKYANARMVVYNANQEEDVKFVFPVASAGEFDLTSVRANVDIYNKLNEKIDSFSTNAIEVPSGEKREVVYNWKADVPIGDYLAKASLIYDEGTINLEESFSVGSRELELQEITVPGFTLGEVAKLEMLVENKWSELISDAFIQTKILNERGDIVSDFKSASYDVEPLGKQVFVSYWDTSGVSVGNYETEISINYGDRSSKKSVEFKVEKNKLTVVGLGYVISAEGGEGPNTLVIVLVIVIIFLVIVNLLWFFLLRKKLRK